MLAALTALGKPIKHNSGLIHVQLKKAHDTSAVQRGIHGGKAYKQGKEYHITHSLAIMIMPFDASAKDVLPVSIWTQ